MRGHTFFFFERKKTTYPMKKILERITQKLSEIINQKAICVILNLHDMQLCVMAGYTDCLVHVQVSPSLYDTSSSDIF